MPPDYKAKLSSTLEDLQALLVAMRTFLEEKSIPNKTIKEAELVTEELISNTIKYGYMQSSDGTIEVTVHPQKDLLLIRIEDHAPAFDPTSHPKPNTSKPIYTRSIGGMGIELGRKITQSFDYARSNGHNRITLTIPYA